MAIDRISRALLLIVKDDMQKSKNRITSDNLDFLKEVLNTLEDGVYIVNQQCDIQFVNRAIMKEFGQPGNRKCFQYFHGRSEVCPWCVNEQVFKGKSVSWQWFNPQTGRTYDLFDMPLRNPDGGISKLEFFHEITNLKQAEQDLKISEVKYKTLFESLPLGITVSDNTGAIVESNDESERLLGLSEEEQAKRKVGGREWKIIRPDGSPLPPEEFASVRALKEQKRIDDIEMGVVRPDGTISWINVTAAPLPLEGYGVVIAYSDIGTRKTVETKLQESLAFLNRMIEQSPTPMWISDEKGTLIRINKACCDLLNITRDDVLNKYNVLQDNIVEEQGFLPLVKNVFEKAQVARFELQYDTPQLKQLVLDKPAHVMLDVTIFPIVDLNGRVTNAVIQHIDITRRKMAEEALLKEQESYRTLVNNAAEAIFVIQDSKVVYSNPRSTDIFGPPLQDGSYRDFLEFVHADDRKLAADNYQRRLNKEAVDETYPLRVIDQQGNTRWTLVTSVLIDWKDRLATMCFLTDVTDRRTAEMKIEESESLYRNLIETSPHAVGLMDMNGNIIMYNRQALEIYGFENSEDLKGRNVMELVAPENYQEVLDSMQVLLKEGAVRNLELRSFKKDGRPFYIQVSSTLLRDKENKPQSVLIVFQDITERKKAEAILQESETRYRLLFENMLNGMAYCKMDFKDGVPEDFTYLAVNNAFEYLTGLKDVAGKKVTEAIPGIRQSNPELFEIYGRVALTGQPERFETHIESLGIWLSIAVFSTEKGYFVAVFDNITERKQAEEKLRKSFKGLRKTLNDAIDTMAKIVELRDPYTAGHQKRVADLCVAIVHQMMLGDEVEERLRMAATIHDIGKMYVPSDILSKPGKLGVPEFQLVKTHPQYGYDIVKSMDFPCCIADAVLQHHERLDGSGYPKGLKGEDIIMEARILAVADVVEAMASHRPYREAPGLDRALNEIKSNSGRLYDPRVVEACVRVFEEGKLQL